MIYEIERTIASKETAGSVINMMEKDNQVCVLKQITKTEKQMLKSKKEFVTLEIHFEISSIYSTDDFLKKASDAITNTLMANHLGRFVVVNVQGDQ